MTEAEWLACDDPAPMLAFLKRNGKQLQLRLFGCAICRQVQRLMGDEHSRAAVEVAERRAAGLASEREVRAVRSMAIAVYEATLPSPGQATSSNWDGPAYSACNAAGVARWVLTVHVLTTARLAAYALVGEKYRPSGVEHADAETFRALVRAEFKKQAALLRDIAGNPYCPVNLIRGKE